MAILGYDGSTLYTFPFDADLFLLVPLGLSPGRSVEEVTIRFTTLLPDHYRVAIYNDAPDVDPYVHWHQPGQRVCESAKIARPDASGTYTVPIPLTVLTAGKFYWLMILYDGPATIPYALGDDEVFEKCYILPAGETGDTIDSYSPFMTLGGATDLWEWEEGDYNPRPHAYVTLEPLVSSSEGAALTTASAKAYIEVASYSAGYAFTVAAATPQVAVSETASTGHALTVAGAEALVATYSFSEGAALTIASATAYVETPSASLGLALTTAGGRGVVVEDPAQRLRLFDYETGDLSEHDVTFTVPDSTLTVLTDPDAPGLGTHILRATRVNGKQAYTSDSLPSIAPGQTVSVGFWMRPDEIPPVSGYCLQLYSSSEVVSLQVFSGGWLIATAYPSGGLTGAVLTAARWSYAALSLTRASASGVADGIVTLYLDGVAVGTVPNLDNFNLAASPNLFFGALATSVHASPYICDFDELQLTVEKYPEPRTPEATSTGLCPERIVLLYNPNDPDSDELARIMGSAMGIPLANGCPLPNASAAETLPDYAAFQAQIETDLLDWLDRHPAIAAKTMAFVIGYQVPQFFTAGGVLHTTASRLQNLGNAFSSQTANPFYGRTSPITAAELAAEGRYLAASIDGGSQANAGLAFLAAGAVAIDADDFLCYDGNYFTASILPAQKTRLQLADDQQTPCAISFGSALSGTLRVDAAALTSLRSGQPDLGLFFSAAGAVGTDFDPETYLDALRNGCTLGEAALFASAAVDYTTLPVGITHETLDFPLGGYNIYQSETLIGAARPGQTALVLPHVDLPVNVPVPLTVRTRSTAGVEEADGTAIEVFYDGTDLSAPRPNALLYAQATPTAGGSVSIRTRYSRTGEAAKATHVQIARITHGVADWASPLATWPISNRPTTRTLTQTFPHGQTVRLAMRAITAGLNPVAGPATVLSPVVADSQAPTPVGTLEVLS